MIDITFIILGSLLGFIFVYWAWRISPTSLLYCITVYLFSSWLSFILVILSIWFNLWDYTSPSLTWGGSILITNILYYPPYGVALALLLRNFWKNVFLTVAFTGLLTFSEYLIVQFSNFLEYHIWNYGLTLVSYLIPFSLVSIFASWIKRN